MGIPHLAQQLQPHGTKVLLSRASTSDGSNPTPAIIDGPSLAYHCFYVCLSRQSSARNSYEALPSYKDLGEAAVSWLEQIEQYGMKVENIFFDGLLPLSKKPTRLSRLQNYANQIVSFRASNKEDLPPRSSVESRKSGSDLLSNVSLSARLKALPAPPFLVPAVIEAILSSRFADVTSTIPGEADAYCAQSARLSGGTIFTSDSDLLVHDLGKSGTVILFRDIETIHLPSKGTCLKTQQYQPSAIADKFGLPNLVRLAFFMTEDNHCKIAEATKLAKERNPTSDEFAEFQEQYASLPVLSTLAKEYLTQSDRPVFKLLSSLDPRISELVHQIAMQQAATSAEDRTLDMYLPFLIDDSTRTSAWRAGAYIRTTAYSVLRSLDPRLAIINEYERKGTRVSSTPATAFHYPKELSASILELQEGLKETLPSGNSTPLTIPARWRVFAAKTIYLSNVDTGKTPPSIDDLTRLITGSREGPLSWSFIHASAQMQAVLYSLRMILQISRLVAAFTEESDVDQESRIMIAELQVMLKDLPSLSDLLDVEEIGGIVQTEAAKTHITNSLLAFGVPAQTDESSTKRKKKRKKKEDHTSTTSPPAWRSNNMFGSLS